MTEGNDDKQAALTNAAHIFISLTKDTTLHICITKCYANMQASCLYHCEGQHGKKVPEFAWHGLC